MLIVLTNGSTRGECSEGRRHHQLLHNGTTILVLIEIIGGSLTSLCQVIDHAHEFEILTSSSENRSAPLSNNCMITFRDPLTQASWSGEEPY
jgi:hypothetical protein